jgi:hypothetical protein
MLDGLGLGLTSEKPLGSSAFGNYNSLNFNFKPQPQTQNEETTSYNKV